MALYRSPTFLSVFGGTTFCLSVVIYLIAGKSAFAWALLILACPPIVEREASRNLAMIGSMVYGKDADCVERLAYQPAGALLRCSFFLCFLATAFLLGRGGYDLLPDSGWVAALIIGPPLLYLVWAAVAYWKSIASVARQENWSKSRRMRG